MNYNFLYYKIWCDFRQLHRFSSTSGSSILPSKRFKLPGASVYAQAKYDVEVASAADLYFESPLEIVEYPDPILRAKNKRIVTFDDNLKKLVDKMFDIMYKFHSSPNIKKEVLQAGALQPVIRLLSSCCSESQREAALLLGQFAATDTDCKMGIWICLGTLLA
ncbi:hypothetical protein POM88_053159 [Heracleum sosnowskyi]|uniref:peptide deformylase n=1 Tax=Heracleum sosnowskyi TaxID=360622 RepID=A0AAD8LY58_9APIA|nr:hypothetical protein POM88_053159 [Heracleum sosnowskyi]